MQIALGQYPAEELAIVDWPCTKAKLEAQGLAQIFKKTLVQIKRLPNITINGNIRRVAYEVKIKKSQLKILFKLPDKIQEKFRLLVQDLIDKGPEQPSWSNYSKLGKEKYHCHLTYSYVACWTCEKQTVKIEVYYVGSRENAPY